MPSHGQLGQLWGQSEGLGRHDPRTAGGCRGGRPTKAKKKQKWKYVDRETAMAARKQRRNRARAERRRRARSHLMAAGKVIEAQRKIQRGTSTQKKTNVRRRFAKSVRRTKQKRRRCQAVNRRIWQELRMTTQKREDPETLTAQPVNTQVGEVNERPVDGQSSVQKAPTQPWVAVGSSTTDCAPKVGRSKDDGVLLKIKIQIQGRTYIALIDSGASRNYASPEAVVEWELPGTPELVHLELADGSKI